MAVNLSQQDYYTFVAGLNTEAGYFTFPPNTFKDAKNVKLNIDGSFEKRLAFDFETNHTKFNSITKLNADSYGYTVMTWESVNGNGNLNFFVVQMGPTLQFFQAVSGTVSGTYKFSLDLTPYKVPNSNPLGQSVIKAVSASGKLIITSKDTEPVLVTYNESTDTISHSEILIEIRDFEGVSDGLLVDQRPSSLSAEHNYNLRNQGWDAGKISSYQTAKGVYPSNAQSWVYGKNVDDDFDASVLDKQDFGTSPAPKGRYILEAFYRDRSNVSGVSGIPVQSESYRPTVCAFFAGRAWFAGTQSTKIGSWVMFSQVATDSTKYGQCYQSADPTSEVISDLVDSDGGVIPIQDVGEIIDLMPISNGILVIASNGVWQVTGTSQSGFSASSYEVSKVTTYGCVSQKSIVQVENGIIYWSNSGIYAVQPDQLGSYQAQSLTDLNIKSLYIDIPVLGKQMAIGDFNNDEKVIYWIYNDTGENTQGAQLHRKNKVLVLDIRLKAFYQFDIADSVHSTYGDSAYIVDVIVTKESSSTTDTYNVIDGSGNQVIDSSNNTVVADLDVYLAGFKQFKFLSVVPTSATQVSHTFSDLLRISDAPIKFKEWYTYNGGVGFDTYAITGYNLAPNGASKVKQLQYVTTFLKRTETEVDIFGNGVNESSCKLQARWDFADTGAAGKWSTEEQVYRHRRNYIHDAPSADYNDGYPLVISKTKIRGRGKSVQFKFSADADTDMKLVGWSTTMIGATNV